MLVSYNIFSWAPMDMELLDIGTILNPVVIHIDGFLSFFFKGAVRKSDGYCIVKMHSRCGLRVDHIT